MREASMFTDAYGGAACQHATTFAHTALPLDVMWTTLVWKALLA